MDIKTLKVRDVIFGKGMPKICVPIVSESKPDILESAKRICTFNPDCIEWRMDWFSEVLSDKCVLDVLRELRNIIGNRVLLATFRTAGEGGERDIAIADYKHLYKTICESGYADMIDVEVYMENKILSSMCQIAHDNNVYVVASNHDFSKTPDMDELVKRLEFMDFEGADIPKIAVMPNNKNDVLTLLSATLKYHENGGSKPVITMSMSKMGILSRMAGEFSGSALTFATVDKASAPGQLPIDELRDILKIIHEYY